LKSIAVIIVAAGRGQRAGGGLPKQYRVLAGMPVLRRTIDILRRALPNALMRVVIHPDDQSLYASAVEGLSVPPAVFGGDTRQASVFNGLKSLSAEAPDIVLVHDAARPFIDRGLIQRLLDALHSGAEAVIPALAVTDTLKTVEQGIIVNTVDRSGLYSVQTPQAFVFKTLLAAHCQVEGQQLTDDGAVIEAAGVEIAIREGDERNFKLTHLADFGKAETQIMMQTADIRVGSGYDVHRFTSGDSLCLCGIEVPFSKSLKGHSDADVALHAITDAILAAVAAGDIGTHFPPSEEKWAGVSSHVFLEHAADIVREKSGLIAHITVCIICEAPKIGPHVQKMRHKIADILKINIDRISVQATTTERLGFTGREEGIAAHATATVRLPMGAYNE